MTEKNAPADELLECLTSDLHEYAAVPTLFRYELLNLLWTADCRGRVDKLTAFKLTGRAEWYPFRAIDRWGSLEDRALTPQAVNLILKRRCAMAGLDPSEFSAHGLRSGYLTEAARVGVPLPEAMQQSQHRSVQQAANYYNDAERRRGKGARLGL